MGVTAGLRSNLSVYCYVAPTSGYDAQSTQEISSLITGLSLTSMAPGGFGDFTAILALRDARIPRAEFALFSQIQVSDGPNVVWAGEITDPEMGMSESLGEYVRITGLGLGNALRDDPIPTAYAAQTAQQIVKDQLARRTNGSPYNLFSTISTDTRYIFPDNPAATFSPVYDNRTMEEVIADVCQLAGDYQWGVWAHPLVSQINGAGYRLGVLSVQKRDTTTTHYVASIAEGDITAHTVSPTSERAYNRIYVDYTTPTGGVGTASYVDPRLTAGTLAQGKAPFRARKLVRDYSGTSTIGATQAQSIANTYGAQYQNPSNKISLTLKRVRDANGNPIPLWAVRADQNIFVRDFAQRGRAPLPSSPTPGVNQFYIVRAEYREDTNGATLTLDCDNFVDRAATQIARLTLAADVKSRTNKTTGQVQAQGAAASGYVALGQSNALAGNGTIGEIQYPVQLYQAPTAISFTQISNINLNSIGAGSINALGAIVSANATANGSTKGGWTYATSGNCIRRIGRKYLDWHCDGCGKEFKDLAIARFVRVNPGLHPGREYHPGHVMLAIDCPECAAGEHPFTESFNTALRKEDEAHPTYHHRREQATLIRQLQRHGAVGLETLP